jgi:hypothetical protein
MPAAVTTDSSRFTADADKEALNRVAVCAEAFEGGIGREFRERCEKFYRQYRSFDKLRSAWIPAPAGPRRDAVRRETRLGRAASHPAQLPDHRDRRARRDRAAAPDALLPAPPTVGRERRQRPDPDRRAAGPDRHRPPVPGRHAPAGSTGSAFGKVLWRKQYATRRRAAKRTFRPGYHAGVVTRELVFDDPDFVDVDVFDIMWDPFGSDVDSCGWMMHRTWLSLEQCLDRCRSGQWNTASVKAMLKDGREEEHLRNLGGRQRYDEVWQARMEASGFTQSGVQRGEHVHELLEWHDGEKVCAVLDRALYVLEGENPVLGTKPFMVYRPTPLQKQMVGIGDLEPLEHLQRANDTTMSPDHRSGHDEPRRRVRLRLRRGG